MRKMFLVCLLTAVVLLPSVTFAGESVVTAKTLNISHVQTYIARKHNDPRWIITIFGIHQNGNSATVYVHTKHPQGADGSANIHLVRLNSGKWFVTNDEAFLMK